MWKYAYVLTMFHDMQIPQVVVERNQNAQQGTMAFVLGVGFVLISIIRYMKGVTIYSQGRDMVQLVLSNYNLFTKVTTTLSTRYG
jgi:hypothetical protein